MPEPPRTTRSRGVWWVVAVLLLVPIVMPLVVPMYARETPQLFGFPFFYWYQFMWIIIAATVTSIAYQVVARQERRDRQVRRDQRGGGAR